MPAASAKEKLRIYEALLSATPDLGYVFDLDHRFIYANPALLKIWGRSWDEAIGKRCIDLGYEPWHAEMHDREIDQVIATGKPIRGDVAFGGTSGRRFYDYIFTPVFDDNGKVALIAGTTRDITERKQSEEILRRAEERRRLALEASYVLGAWEWDIVSDKVTADERFSEMFNLAPEESSAGVKIARAFAAIHPEDMHRIHSEIEKAIAGNHDKIAQDYRVVRPDGQIRWVSLRGQVQRDETGKAIRFPGIGVDITSERKALESLQESRRQLQQMTDAIPQQVWAARPDGQLDYINEQCKIYSGHVHRDGSLVDWTSIIHPDDRQNSLKIWTHSVATGAGYEVEQRIYHKASNEFRWNLSRARPVANESGQIVKWFGTNTDIHDLKLAQQALQEARLTAEAANNAKTEFLATMSHEIRTPMNAVIGLSNILGMTPPLTSKQKVFVETLKTSAGTLLDLINDLLDIAKIEARSIDLEHIPFSVPQIIREVFSIMELKAREKGLSFAWQSGCACIERRSFIGDPARMRQILLNLCGNAIKFTETGGVDISIDCAPADEPGYENITIKVKDTGIGIAPDKIGSIFNKFVQADSSINRKYGGTGLGLTISEKLAAAMGGSITVTSEPGRGSVFTVFIPMRVVDNGACGMSAPDPAPHAEAWRSDSPLILLVEDYMPNVMVASAFLEDFGYRCELAASGVEAVEKYQVGKYRLVLMDVQMHGMNGFEATALIRDHERRNGWNRTPIIGMTAHALAGDREQCIAAGMDDYISKPFDPEALKKILHERLK